MQGKKTFSPSVCVSSPWKWKFVHSCVCVSVCAHVVKQGARQHLCFWALGRPSGWGSIPGFSVALQWKGAVSLWVTGPLCKQLSCSVPTSSPPPLHLSLSYPFISSLSALVFQWKWHYGENQQVFLQVCKSSFLSVAVAAHKHLNHTTSSTS